MFKSFISKIREKDFNIDIEVGSYVLFHDDLNKNTCVLEVVGKSATIPTEVGALTTIPTEVGALTTMEYHNAYMKRATTWRQRRKLIFYINV